MCDCCTIQQYNSTTIQQYNKLLAMCAAKKAGEGKESAKLPTDRSSCSTRCRHEGGDTWNLVHTDAQHLIFSPTNFKSYHFLQGPGQGKHFCVFSSCNAIFASSYMGYSRIGMHKHSDWVNQIWKLMNSSTRKYFQACQSPILSCLAACCGHISDASYNMFLEGNADE